MAPRAPNYSQERTQRERKQRARAEEMAERNAERTAQRRASKGDKTSPTDATEGEPN
jgi:hypothetical protein